MLSLVLAGALASDVPLAGLQATPALLVVAYPKACQHGLHFQPNRGPFAVMLFCDDAAGSHIGILCYEPGCQSSDEKPGPWTLSDRFWQAQDWADDVTGFAWDQNGYCLYVSTDGIYGSGRLFALNLASRRSTTIPLRLDGVLPKNGTYGTLLTEVDPVKNLLTYQVEYFDTKQKKTVIELKTLALPACRVKLPTVGCWNDEPGTIHRKTNLTRSSTLLAP